LSTSWDAQWFALCYDCLVANSYAFIRRWDVCSIFEENCWNDLGGLNIGIFSDAHYYSVGYFHKI
ncbi:MAG: hypothetical protein RR428_07615, partial [Coprobacillus sp.]